MGPGGRGGGFGEQASAMGSLQAWAPTAGELPLSGSSLLKWLPVCLPLLLSISLCVGLLRRCLSGLSLSARPFELWGSSGGCGAKWAWKGQARARGCWGSRVGV